MIEYLPVILSGVALTLSAYSLINIRKAAKTYKEIELQQEPEYVHPNGNAGWVKCNRPGCEWDAISHSQAELNSAYQTHIEAEHRRK